MLTRLSFRSKLLLVLFVPFIALVVVAGAGLNDRFAALYAQEQYGQVSGPMRSVDSLSRALQNEAVVSSWFVSADGEPTVELQAARERTDAAESAFHDSEQALLDAGAGGAAIAAINRTNADLDNLRRERTKIDGLTEGASRARAYFLDTDSDLLAVGEGVAYSLHDPGAAASVARLTALQRVEHELAREAGIYASVRASADPAPASGEELAGWVSANVAQQRERAQFLNGASPAEAAAFNKAIANEPVETKVPTAFPTSDVSADAVVRGFQEQARSIDKGIAAVDAVITDAAAARADAARRDVLVYGGVAVIAMLLTLVLIWFVTRAVVRPVRRLTEAARDMSQRQLPELVELLRVGGDVSTVQPAVIDVSADDEIAELAQAFSDVQAVTFDVAQEQSRLLRKGMGDLFVNLARRNQSLLERQLELLDDLERNEHDPAALDSLFKLDHMATRMRRNAESLLVLSGAEQPRQWQQPIALLDVVRAAAAEIADFPRVELVGIDDELAITGRAVADLAHLVAELLENATSFSPPDSAVVVSGAPTSSGFVLAISDQGIGMAADRVAEANELLARPPAVGLALSRALGLHVVGSLAARHGISVELRPGAPVGTVALVTLPTAILERTGAGVSPAEPTFSPDLGPDGQAAPLVTRQVAWRPPDEPPVEEWRREGLASESIAAPAQAPAPAAVPDPAPAPAPAPAPKPIQQEDAVVHPIAEVPPTEVPLPPVVEDEPEPVPTAERAFDDGGPGTDEPPHAADDDDYDDGPLPTRVPGQHLSHQPS
ncbi:MAG TPA: nitrate- and nitrite sensing domain-containing protein, partial [Acidimicrobiia bacterium]|nr:nitrate- and nitrite sensing domain-containing protein [Acidimicrobiia bacterium]